MFLMCSLMLMCLVCLWNTWFLYSKMMDWLLEYTMYYYLKYSLLSKYLNYKVFLMVSVAVLYLYLLVGSVMMGWSCDF